MITQERQTKQKSLIYDALKTLDHPTATEVYGYLHDVYPSLSRATVFRVLSGFASSGRALELRYSGHDVRYDYNVNEHYHAHCKHCGRVADIFSKEFSDLGKDIPKHINGFEIDGFVVEFSGSCESCRKEMGIEAFC